VITVINIVLLVLIGIPLGYLALLSLLACFARKTSGPDARSFRRFAIIVPAHNEESCLADTIRSLQEIEYPCDNFQIVVVADNCTDGTANIARAGGARTLERFSVGDRSKGHALQWTFCKLLTEGFDAFVVCDADTVASRNLLLVMNSAMDQGARVVQCSDLVKPAPGVWSSEATRAGFLLYNFVRPLGRMVLGCSAGLRGNGMGFTAETLREVPWVAYSRAEDLEYGLILLLRNIPTRFVPSAFVHATMPTNARNAETQRARWEGGRYPLIRRYAWPLFREAIRKRSFPLLDAWIDLVTPPFINMMLLVILGTGVNALAWSTGITPGPTFAIFWGAVGVLGLLHVVLGFASADALQDLFHLLQHVPRYALWKLRLYSRLAFAGDAQTWVRTTRETPVTQEKS
jgi:1,2-diacylglycerol 3-beta-glucosyltransferase